MTPDFWLVIDLAFLMCAAVTSLWLDARQRRIDHRLADALPEAEARLLEHFSNR